MIMGKWRRFVIVAGFILLLAAAVLLPARETAAAGPTFTLLTPLPTTMVVGETHTVEIAVHSDEPFVWARALGDDYYPGRGAVIHGGDIIHSGTEGTLYIEVIARSTTDQFPDGYDPMAIAVGVRYQGGEIVSEWFSFNVVVNP